MDENQNKISAQDIINKKPAKRFAVFSNKITMIIFILFGLAVVVLALYDFLKSKNTNNLVVLFIFSCVFFVFAALVYISNRRMLQKSPDSTSANLTNQYSTDTSVTFVTPFDTANISENEKVLNWVGPVYRQNLMLVDTQLLGKEKDKAPENTLLFTDNQIIAIMIGPQDIEMMKTNNGPIKNLTSDLVNFNPEDYYSKDIQNQLLYYKQWSKIMENILSLPLNQILSGHLNFGVPNSLIESVKLKNRIVNPGFVFNLKDGNKMSYTTFDKSRINEVADFLSSKFKVTN